MSSRHQYSSTMLPTTPGPPMGAGLVDDLLDDSQWRNVQEPIKQMFLSLSKAMRVQSAGLRDLDHRCDRFVTTDAVKDMVNKYTQSCCSKEDATQIIYQLEKKATEKDVSALEHRLDQAYQVIDKMQDQLQTQGALITELTSKLEVVSQEVQHLRNPTYDQIFSYIDRQVEHVVDDVDRKLAIKADRREVETVVPQRMEELYRTLTGKYQDLKVDVARSVTKEEFIAVVQNKAEKQEVRDFVVAIAEKANRHEIAQAISLQIKPIVSAMAALEKAITIQDIAGKKTEEALAEKSRQLTKAHEDLVNSGILEFVQHNTLNEAKIEDIVLNIFKEKRVGELDKTVVETMLVNNMEYYMKQVNMVSESIRLELSSIVREDIEMVKSHFQTTMTQQGIDLKATVDKLQRTRSAVKELSSNVAKELSKKLDIKDFERTIRNYGDGNEIPYNNRMEAILNKETSSKSRRNGIGSDGEEDVDTDSTSTSSSPTTFSATSSIGPISGKDPNKQFDHLIKSMKKRSTSRGRGNKGSDGEEIPMRRTSMTPPRIGSRSGSNSRVRLSNQDNSDISDKTVKQLQDDLVLTKTDLRTLQRDFQDLLHKIQHQQQQGNNNVPPRSPTRLNLAHSLSASTSNPIGPLQAGTHQSQEGVLDRIDWRIALGEVSMNLRREISDKANREEVYSLLRNEQDSLLQRIKRLEKGIDNYITVDKLVEIENELLTMKNKVSSELTGARFLWTNGVLVNDGWIPWDIQVINAAPSIILWQKNTTCITVRIPGLYRLAVSIFTIESAIIQVYLNDEPILSYQPESIQSSGVGGTSGGGNSPIGLTPMNSFNNNPITSMIQNTRNANNDRYYLKRLRHSAGEVTCLTIDEFISLPPEANLSVRFYSTNPAQAFFSLKKM